MVAIPRGSVAADSDSVIRRVSSCWQRQTSAAIFLSEGPSIRLRCSGPRIFRVIRSRCSEQHILRVVGAGSVPKYPRPPIPVYCDVDLVARAAFTLRQTGPQIGWPASAGSRSSLGWASNALLNSLRHEVFRPDVQAMNARYL